MGNFLKTLKDFESAEEGNEYNSGYADAKEDLRKEAIKWIKSIRILSKELETSPPDTKLVKEIIRENKGKGLFIKHFFNITEEDLEE